MAKPRLAIVGAGIGGCALGALLARGLDVSIFEKNSLVGGRCTSYVKQGFHVDVGVHLFAEGAKGPHGEVCRRMGRPDAIRWVLCRDPRPLLFYQGKSHTYSRETMMDLVPKAERNSVFNLFGAMLTMKEPDIGKWDHVTLTEFANQYTRDPTIHTLLAGICGQYFVIPPPMTSAGEFIRSFKAVVSKRASAYPMGGEIAIPRAYCGAVEEAGGTVKTSTPVKRILIEDGRAAGVELHDGKQVMSDAVAVNSDLKEGVVKLVGERHLPRDYVESVKKLKYALYVYAIKVALDAKLTDQKLILSIPGSIEEMGDYLKTLEKGGVPDDVGGMLMVPSNFDPGLAPPGKQMILFGTACLRRGNWEKWRQACLDSLERVVPGVKKHTVFCETTSPEDINQWTGEDGNVIGVAQSPDQVADRRPRQESPIPGLYFVGAETGGWGVGTELAARSALELEPVLRKALGGG
ncbi:MAG: NAD(P)/FAD-dependent oxidoreductase [Euryarchaeota archaeon]|nr:NAD(P)/FAD-dependent oxidoreductase [Euryarchaeota archaeon]